MLLYIYRKSVVKVSPKGVVYGVAPKFQYGGAPKFQYGGTLNFNWKGLYGWSESVSCDFHIQKMVACKKYAFLIDFGCKTETTKVLCWSYNHASYVNEKIKSLWCRYTVYLSPVSGDVLTGCSGCSYKSISIVH